MVLFDTVFPADSVEFCPHPSAQNIFVCGTYKLNQHLALVEDDDERTQISGSPILPHRQGQCLVFDVQREPTATLEGEL